MSAMGVNGYKGVMDSVVAKLQELMTGDMCANLIGVSRGDILFLRDELPAMNALLEKLDDAEELDPEAKNWRHQVREMAYDIEDCIDDFRNNITSVDAKAGFLDKASHFLKTCRAHLDVAWQIKGGQLTEAVRRQPHTLILFDEIEKAHPDVFNVMLQILDDGRLTDGKGRTVDFKNTLIVMTSNIGRPWRGYDRIKDMVGQEMKRHFRPEFLNRLDETIMFRQLTKVEVKEIAGIILENVAARARKKGVKLQVTERFRDLVVEESFDTSYGVRPLKRAILRLLKDTLADKILAGEIKDGGSVTVDADLTGNVVFRHQG